MKGKEGEENICPLMHPISQSIIVGGKGKRGDERRAGLACGCATHSPARDVQQRISGSFCGLRDHATLSLTSDDVCIDRCAPVEPFSSSNEPQSVREM